MGEKLKIYACSGVEDQSGEYNYWTDNTDTMSNTQAVNTLLALINRNFIEVNYMRNMTPDEKIANLNDIDAYVVSLYFAEHHAEHYKQLERAGKVVCKMLADGAFNYDSLENGERDLHLDELLQKAKDIFDDDMPLEWTNDAFKSWWEETIIARNKVGLTKEQQSKIRKVSDKWKEDKNISKYLLDASTYFLYTYLTDAQLRKLPAVFKYKKQKQIQVYNYCKSYFVGVYGSEDEMREIIYSGIVKQFGDTPEDVCEDIVNGKREAVGIPIQVVVALIGAAVTIITTVIPLLIQAIGNIISAKYASIDSGIVNSSCPNPEDFEDVNTTGRRTSGISWLPIAAIGAGLLLLMKKSN